jgi:hypothetical protein
MKCIQGRGNTYEEEQKFKIRKICGGRGRPDRLKEDFVAGRCSADEMTRAGNVR